MPGSEACGRCGTSMRLATAVMDVQPPRAGKFRKKLRRVLPVRKAYYGVRDGMETVPLPHVRRPSFSINDVTGQVPPWPLTWRMIVPGCSHFYAGRRVRGHLFLWGFLLLLLPGLLLMGSAWGSFWLGLAFSVHTSAALDVVNFTYPNGNFRQLMVRSIIVTICVLGAIYVPAAWVMTRGAAVRVIDAGGAPFQPGDVVLVNQAFHRGGFPRAGQVVMYDQPAVRADLVWHGHGRRIRQYGGEAVDRVLAVAGDKVEWNGKWLTVNGNASPHRPMNAAAITTAVSLTVPADAVFILPSTTPDAADASARPLLDLSVIPVRDVAGTVYFRTQPFSRIEVIR